MVTGITHCTHVMCTAPLARTRSDIVPPGDYFATIIQYPSPFFPFLHCKIHCIKTRMKSYTSNFFVQYFPLQPLHWLFYQSMSFLTPSTSLLMIQTLLILRIWKDCGTPKSKLPHASHLEIFSLPCDLWFYMTSCPDFFLQRPVQIFFDKVWFEHLFSKVS